MNESVPRRGQKFLPHQMPLRKMALNAVCGTLLLPVLLPLCWIAGRWIESQTRQVLDQWSGTSCSTVGVSELVDGKVH